MARKKVTIEGEDASSPTFEDALAGLEGIVEAMEHEHLTLEELVAHYEKGSRYLAHCESVLQSARGRIELITLRNQNEISLDAGAKPDENSDFPTASDDPEDPDDDDNDIRLF
jgi:exodeoxyribonuclease VII small subunit